MVKWLIDTNLRNVVRITSRMWERAYTLSWAKFAKTITSNSILGKLLRQPLRIVPKDAVVSVLSGLNRGMKWRVGSTGVNVMWVGAYENEKQNVVKRLVKPGMTVFDVGANAGFYTLAFSRLVGEQGQVWAFEPFHENAASIAQHIKINQLQNAQLLQAAVADTDGTVGFQVGKNNCVGGISQEGQYKVPMVSLDKLILDQALPVPEVLKIDVEGAETLVLEGASSLLSEKPPIVLLALHGDDQKERCLEILQSKGYKIFSLDGSPLSEDSFPGNEIYALPRNNWDETDKPVSSRVGMSN